MAKLFLSYSRKDAAKALRLCGWLEREGHEVWRDEDDIGGGASFSAEIEQALKDCDAVVVLWSASSVQSAWVRDEAGFGRDANKLIPLILDGTDPPLGFRQFQSLDVSKWRGHGDPPLADRVTNAIARISGSARTPAPRTHGRPKSRPQGAIAAVAAALIVGGSAVALFLWRSGDGGRITIAVTASSASPDHVMALDYANVAAADMASFLPRRFDRATVIAPADASGRSSAYRMLVSTDSRGTGADASLTLTDDDGQTTLWSKNWSVADATAADLKAEVSTFASKAALCLTDAKGGPTRLSQPALGLYLSGCTALGDTSLSNEEFETTFERLTKLAPEFAPAWDYLALSRSWIAQSLDKSSPDYPSALKNARDSIRVARRLNPNSAMTYDAEYHLVSNDTFRALQLLEEGAKIDPNDGRIQMHLADELLAVGRLADSVQAAKRGVELEPSEPYNRSEYILSLVYSGQFSKAKADIAEARKKWPRDPAIDFAEFGLQFRYGDPQAALELLPRVTGASDAQMAPYRKLLAARAEPSPAKIDDAIAALSAARPDDPGVRNKVLLALGNFGRVDEVYKLLEDPTFQPFAARDALFRPDFARVRADRRFMQVAARLGLVRYWQKTGYWPDFCTSEKLKYDCKAEAAKYPG